MRCYCRRPETLPSPRGVTDPANEVAAVPGLEMPAANVNRPRDPPPVRRTALGLAREGPFTPGGKAAVLESLPLEDETPVSV